MGRMQQQKILMGLLAGLSIGSANALDPDDFAVGWPLELSAESSFYDIPLRAEVYRHARRLEEMAVLDANGQAMPFYRVVAEPGPATESRATLDVSPVYRTQGGEVVGGLTVEATDERVDISLGLPPEGRAEIVAFVADARALESTPVAADLRWNEMDQPFLTTVTMSHSNDLARWSVVGQGSIAALAIDDTQVRHSRIAINGRLGGYYRIEWAGDTPSPWLLEQLDLISSAEPDPTPVERVGPEAVPAPEEAEEYALFFDAGGLLPVRALELGFANPNGWANAAIHSGDSLDGPWNLVAIRRFYYRIDLQTGQVRSPVVEVARRAARYWRVLPHRPLDEDTVELQLHYPQEFLRFAANGAAPYLLVGGGLSTEAGPDAVLGQIWDRLDEAMSVSVARLGTMRELGGEAVFLPPQEFPWRSALLWGALSVGALAVGWMALRLGRDAFA